MPQIYLLFSLPQDMWYMYLSTSIGIIQHKLQLQLAHKKPPSANKTKGLPSNWILTCGTAHRHGVIHNWANYSNHNNVHSRVVVDWEGNGPRGQMKGIFAYRTLQIAGLWVMAQNHFKTYKKGVLCAQRVGPQFSGWNAGLLFATGWYLEGSCSRECGP